MKRWMSGILLVLTALLASCGGGGSSCGWLAGQAACKSDTTAKVIPSTAVVEPTTLTVLGTAAEGLAIGLAPVSMVCVQGQAQAKTDENGGFAVVAHNAIAPCMLQVTSQQTGQRYHAIWVSGPRINVTPITEMVSAAALVGQPVQVFELDSPARATRLASMQEQVVSNALNKVIAATSQISGVELNSAVDYLKGTFVAATPARAGDVTDRKLDALMSAMESSGKSFADFNLVLFSNSGSALSQAVQNLLGVATDSLTGCPAARSGKYWLLTSTGYGFFFVQGLSSKVTSITLESALGRASRQFIEDGVEKNERMDFYPRYTTGNAVVPCLFDVAVGDQSMEMRVTANGIGLLNTREDTVAVMLPRQVPASLASFAGKNFRMMGFGQIDGLDVNYNYATQLSQWVFGVGGESLSSYKCGVSGATVNCDNRADKTMSVRLRPDGVYEIRAPDGTPTMGVSWRYRDQTLLWLSMRDGTTLEPVGLGVALSGGSCTPPALGVTHEILSYSATHAGVNRTLNQTQSWLQTTRFDASTATAQLAVLNSVNSVSPSDFYFENWGAFGTCTSYRGSQARFSEVQPRMMMNIGRDLQVGMSTDHSLQKGSTLWLSQRSIRE